MAARWSDLDVQDFSSPLPLRDYLRGPWALPAIGDADGVSQGLPAPRHRRGQIRAATVEGTFNVVDS